MHLVPSLESQFTLFLGAYRNSYNTQHVLIRVLGNGEKILAKMDLSKTFDCIPHYFLIGKFAAHGFKGNTLNTVSLK